MHEVSLALSWMVATLSGDSTLQGYAPGGVWRGEAPPGTAVPYTIITHQPGQSRDNPVFGGARAFSLLQFEVIAAGPAANGQAITNAATRIDTLITTAQPLAVTGGTIQSSFRVTPLVRDTIIDGEMWMDAGGVYKQMVKSS